MRWAVPAGAVAVAAAVTAGSVIGVAQASPALAKRTPAELLAAVAGTTSPPPPLTGTVVETASLGLPQLPGLQDPTSPTSLLTGSHTVRVWYSDPRHVRLAAPVQMGESDLIRSGQTAWVWQSKNNTVTKYALPSQAGHGAQQATPEPSGTPLTPQQAAQRVLAAVGPTTRVSTQSNVMVAGQPAYQLVLAPKDSRSLVGRVSIALDGKHSQVPLRVQVFARGAASPAFQVGYTSVSFVRPAAANFRFSPPSGAKVRQGTLPGGHAGQAAPKPAAGHQGQVIGKDWLSVAVLPSSVLSGLGSGNAAAAAGQAARSASGGAGNVSGQDILAALFKSAKPVHGTWGHGKLLTTSLVSVLITSDGHVLAGAVTPPVLYAAAAKVK